MCVQDASYSLQVIDCKIARAERVLYADVQYTTYMLQVGKS